MDHVDYLGMNPKFFGPGACDLVVAAVGTLEAL